MDSYCNMFTIDWQITRKKRFIAALLLERLRCRVSRLLDLGSCLPLGDSSLLRDSEIPMSSKNFMHFIKAVKKRGIRRRFKDTHYLKQKGGSDSEQIICYPSPFWDLFKVSFNSQGGCSNSELDLVQFTMRASYCSFLCGKTNLSFVYWNIQCTNIKCIIW